MVGPESQPADTRPAIRIVSYNVHGLHDDVRALRSVVRELAPDVLVVQEAPRGLRWRTKVADLAHGCGMYWAVGGLDSLGNVIATNLRVRVRETWCLRYPLTPGRHMRGAAFARCEVEGVPFVVGASHLATDPAERPAQARAFKAALDEAAGPVVLGCDVNETPGSPSWSLLAAGLTDLGAECDKPTFPARRPDRRIDAIMADPRCHVEHYAVVDSAEARRASDHFPIVGDLVLPLLA